MRLSILERKNIKYNTKYSKIYEALTPRKKKYKKIYEALTPRNKKYMRRSLLEIKNI